MNIKVFIKLHELLTIGQTGKPKDLAYKLGLSERSVMYYIAFMKSEMKAPIIYNTFKESYIYDGYCGLCFQDEKKNVEQKPL